MSTAQQIATGIIDINLNLNKLSSQLMVAEQRVVNALGKAGSSGGRHFSKSLTASMRAGLNNVGGMLTSLLKDAVTSALSTGFIAAKWGTELAAKMEMAEVTMQTLLGSMEEGTRLFQEIKSMAIETPFDFNQLRDAGRVLAIKMDRPTAMKSLKMLGDVASGTGADIYELAYAYEKVYGAERVLNYSLRQFERRGLAIYGELAKQLGVSQTEIFQMAKKGEISFKDVERAFKSMTGSGGVFFQATERQSITLYGQMEKLGDTFNEMGRRLGEALRPATEALVQMGIGAIPKITESLESFFSMLTDDRMLTWLENFTEIITKLLNAAVQGVGAFRRVSAGLASGSYYKKQRDPYGSGKKQFKHGTPEFMAEGNRWETLMKAEAAFLANSFPDVYRLNKSGQLMVRTGDDAPYNKKYDPVGGTSDAAKQAVLDFRGKKKAMEDKILEQDAAREDERIKRKYGYGIHDEWNSVSGMLKSLPGALMNSAKALGVGGIVGGTGLLANIANNLSHDKEKKEDSLSAGFSSFEGLHQSIQESLLKDSEQKKIAKNTAQTNKLLGEVPAKIGRALMNTGVFSVFGP